ncbi:MAG TPA: UDP-2,3-diacylglucosamine diphosphatase [Bacteroidota bacterium]|nr:UDP-2,3-diacylglucosamine diphosphatase [Bacteroidota bacterium]
MSTAYFISDAHLGLGPRKNEREKERRLIAFLDHIERDASQLFIVGDLFDAWFEYRTVIPKGFHRLLTKLNDITMKGIEAHYLPGNHDYWMRDYFQVELGMKTHNESLDIMIDSKRIYLCHGDGISKGDLGYRILKKILRNRFNVWLYSWLHPDIGIPIARSSSRSSRQYTSVKKFHEDRGMIELAQQKITEGFDIVIMGHCHQPVYEKIGNGLYINLGDWINHNTYAVLNDGNIQLKKWSDNT